MTGEFVIQGKIDIQQNSNEDIKYWKRKVKSYSLLSDQVMSGKELQAQICD